MARIQDAINIWDAILAPYSVMITEVTDPGQANLVIDTGTTSPSGGAVQGVLGCFNAPNARITILQGWDWYAGADPGGIGADQYDFETTVIHELGHAPGLGHSTDPASPMYPTLATGVADRTPTTRDLNVPDPPDGADPQMAAGSRPVGPSPILRIVPRPGPAAVGPVAMAPLDLGPMARAGALSGSSSGSSSRITSRGTRVGLGAVVGRAVRFAVRARTAAPQGTEVDSALEDLGSLPSLLGSDDPTSSGVGERGLNRIPRPGT